MCHSGVQKHVSCTGTHKVFPLYYGLCPEMAGNSFRILFHRLFLLYETLMHILISIQFIDNLQN